MALLPTSLVIQICYSCIFLKFLFNASNLKKTEKLKPKTTYNPTAHSVSILVSLSFQSFPILSVH